MYRAGYAALLLTLSLQFTVIAQTASQSPVAHWKVEAEPERFAPGPGTQPLTGAEEGTVEPRENRPAWCPAKGKQCNTPPIGDGWSALTVMADVFVENVRGNYQAIVCRDRWGGPTGDVFGLVISPDGTWTARVKTDKGQCALTTPATAGWHLVALTYDGTHLRLFLDGHKAAEHAHSGTLAPEPGTPIAFGTYSGSANGSLVGALREVRIWSVPLSPQTIAELGKTWAEEVEATRPNGFWFAQASDTHVTDTKSVEIVNDGVDSINADTRVDFSLWLGDLTRAADPDEMVLARLALKRLTKPHYTVRGNHDLRSGVYDGEFGPLRRRLEHRGWVFLLIDSNPGDKTPISQTEHTWIRDQLKTINANTPIVLCTHHPLMPHTKSYLIAGAGDILALFKDHRLKACLSGHYHGNQEETAEGILFTTTACLSTTRGNFDGTKPKGYRLFHCEDDQIAGEFVPVQGQD
ncbi:MAG: hypothetical protein HN742_36550 [Lentisphaerae bacterium]|jgi:predicted phosphodiesterase|nr:hypothetical protein [Lentisphaerota bacterium]MBT4821283.1 hypothetical protein [Lentisphaerota bacterium]MBT5604423.1 hypothetical protein [Lentisphaerota bacterium]MBT7058180.1 hypothetical protein [Lentisphaerota bacterium]MBT7847436.1 hypothetical protein [Lentisphaerota bacterium]